MGVVLSGIFAFTITRDLYIEKANPVDLRNRVVGARLQMDGKPPYFYKWQPKDGLRYYDPINFDTTYANAITASPFIHTLLYPIANLQQREISKIWLFTEYLLHILSIAMAFSLSKTIVQKWMVVIAGSLFLFTKGWISNVYAGQIYFIFPFLSFVFFYFLYSKKNLLFTLLAGSAGAALILSRPTAIVFFLPFIFFHRNLSLANAENPETNSLNRAILNGKYLFIFLLPFIILFGFSILNKKERSYWIDYNKAIDSHIKIHQSDSMFIRNIKFQPFKYSVWEGWNWDEYMHIRRGFEAPKFEASNIQYLTQLLLHKKIPYKVFVVCNVLFILILMLLFYLRLKKEKRLSPAVFAIFGFCLYMTIDFFSPILRNTYDSIQWLFPVFLFSAFYNKKLWVFYAAIMLGVLLIITDASFIKMRQALGEFIIFSSLVWLCLGTKAKLLK